MRTTKIINDGWRFSLGTSEVPANLPSDWQELNLPYTWNGKDGQDGGNDYFRGAGCFVKELKKQDFPSGEEVYLQIDGANSTAKVYFNGKHVCTHHGGYSTFRVKLDDVKENNLLVIVVDNSPNDFVYPQVADFTFYGGIYRDVSLIGVNRKHFDLDYFGAPGIKITPTVCGKDAKVEAQAFCEGEVEFSILADTIPSPFSIFKTCVFGTEEKTRICIRWLQSSFATVRSRTKSAHASGAAFSR